MSDADKPPYSETHPHPTGLEMPPAPVAELATERPYGDPNNPNVDPEFPIQGDDAVHSADRPPPSRGILKNPLRNPTDPRDKEQYVYELALL